MVMVKAKKRLTKEELRHDDFIERVVVGWEYVRHNATTVGAIVAGVLLFVVAISWWVNARGEAKLEAADLLASAQLNRTEASSIYQVIVDDYSGTPAAGKAAFLLAQQYREDNELAQAKVYYKMYIDDYDRDTFLGQAAMAGYAECLLVEGNLDEAAEYYERAAKTDMKNPQSTAFLYSAAAAYQEAGNSGKARSIAQAMLDNSDTDQAFRGRAEMLLQTLGE